MVVTEEIRKMVNKLLGPTMHIGIYSDGQIIVYTSPRSEYTNLSGGEVYRFESEQDLRKKAYPNLDSPLGRALEGR